MARIEFRGLAHSYLPNPNGPMDFAVKELNHVWKNGGAYALLGPSGCGKTTLLNIISGLITPTRGQLFFDDVDVHGLPTERRHIAQVFQFPVVYDTLTVYENLAFPLRNRGVPKAQIQDRVHRIAAMLDLEDRLGHRARGLPADVSQKISLGRGLVRSDVAAILFDEPLTVIDPHLKWELRSKLKALHRELNVTMIYVTHDQTEALTFADRVVVMYEGSVVQEGRPEDLFDRPAHTFVGYFIGSPGMNIVPCTLSGRDAIVNGHPIRLAREYPSLPQMARLELGVRPEFVSLVPPGQGLPVRIERIDDLGAVSIARTRSGDVQINAVINGPRTVPGENAALLIDPARVNIYADSKLVA